jgi:hypothetical protein
MAGGQVSTWCRVDEHTLAAKGKLYDFLYTAEMLWDRRYDPRLRWSVDRWIQALLPDVRRCLSDRPDPRDAPGARLEHVDLAASTRAHAAPSSLSAALPERISIRGVSHPLARPPVTVAAPANVFDLPTLARIPLAAAATGLYFVHSCGASYTPMRVVGNYVVRYADGDDSVIPIEYGHTIADARRRYDAPLAHPAYRHFGYVATYTPDPVFQGSDAEGTNLTLYGFAWRNPRPKEPVAEVVLEATDTYIAVPIQLWALSIIRV